MTLPDLNFSQCLEAAPKARCRPNGRSSVIRRKEVGPASASSVNRNQFLADNGLEVRAVSKMNSAESQFLSMFWDWPESERPAQGTQRGNQPGTFRTAIRCTINRNQFLAQARQANLSGSGAQQIEAGDPPSVITPQRGVCLSSSLESRNARRPGSWCTGAGSTCSSLAAPPDRCYRIGRQSRPLRWPRQCIQAET